jgi:hypothetical protein
MPTAGRHIIARLHQMRIQVGARTVLDGNFLTLCEDYDAAVEALKHWEQSSAGEAGVRADEYRTLISDLEKEILQEMGGSPGRH